MVELSIPDFLLDDSPPLLSYQPIPDKVYDLTKLTPQDEEKKLLSDLFFCLIGCDGTYIRKKDNKYYLACSGRETSINFVKKILPSCDDFIYVQKYSESHLEFKYGRIVHALCAALRSFLNDYRQQIADIQINPETSLSLLMIQLQIPIEMLRLTRQLLQKVKKSIGVPITSKIYSVMMSLRGRPDLQKYLFFLFQESTKPVLSFIEKWVFLGEVDDPQHEFFINQNSKRTIEETIPDSLWDDRYSKVNEMFPNYIFPSVLDKIFSAGKARSILSGYGKYDFKVTMKLTLKDLQVETPITLIWQKSTKELINFFVHEHNLLKCLSALHDILLIQRGDWLFLFLNSADSILHKEREQINLHDFEPHLYSIFNKNYIQFIDIEMEQEQLPYSLQMIHSYDRMKYELKARKITSSKSLWNFFTFKPKIRQPLNLLITEAAKQKYTFLFRHFLFWRRLERKFCKCWKLKISLRGLNIARHSMHIFITNYLNFMTTITVSPQWSKFEKKINEVDVIEHLCEAHEQLLQRLIKGCFILNEKVYKRITYISTLCWCFVKELKKWDNSVSNSFSDIKTELKLAKPIINIYNKFKKAVNNLIKELKIQSEREVDQCYLNFVLICTTINQNYFIK